MTYKKFLYELLDDFTKLYQVTSISLQLFEDYEYVYEFSFSGKFRCIFRTSFFVESFIYYQKGELSIEDISLMMQQTTNTFFCIENGLIDQNYYLKNWQKEN